MANPGSSVGTNDIASLLAVKYVSSKAYGLDTIRKVILSDLAMHNSLVADMVGGLCEPTTDAQRIYGTSTNGDMVKVDEYGRAPTVRQDVGDTVGFPLERHQFALGWTSDFFEKKSPNDLAVMTVDAESAHKRAIVREIKRALFLKTNYTFRDYLVDYVSLSVKRLANADGARIPNGPYGLTFDGSTHAHYVGATSLTTTVLSTLIKNVMEHGHTSGIRVAFNSANEATVRGLTGFTAYLDPRIINPAYNVNSLSNSLDVTDLYDRPIGIYESAEIWIKPWIPSGYAFAWAASDPNKPLAFRQQNTTSLQGLRIPAQFDAFPLHAEYMQAEFGIGVWTRTNGAVVKFDASDTTYVDPTIA